MYNRNMMPDYEMKLIGFPIVCAYKRLFRISTIILGILRKFLLNLIDIHILMMNALKC